MPKYRVREGNFFGIDNQFKAGDVVELTAEGYAGVVDKLEPVYPLPKEEPKAWQTDGAAPKAKKSAPAKETPEAAPIETAADVSEDVALDVGFADDVAPPPELGEVISKPVINAAKRAGIDQPEDFTFLTDEEILAVPRVGKGLLDEIRRLYPYGG